MIKAKEIIHEYLFLEFPRRIRIKLSIPSFRCDFDHGFEWMNHCHIK